MVAGSATVSTGSLQALQLALFLLQGPFQCKDLQLGGSHLTIRLLQLFRLCFGRKGVAVIFNRSQKIVLSEQKACEGTLSRRLQFDGSKNPLTSPFMRPSSARASAAPVRARGSSTVSSGCKRARASERSPVTLNRVRPNPIRNSASLEKLSVKARRLSVVFLSRNSPTMKRAALRRSLSSPSLLTSFSSASRTPSVSPRESRALEPIRMTPVFS